MSLQHAFMFIKLVRTNESLRRHLLDDKMVVDAAELSRLGSEQALNFTSEELQTAYRHDWIMRWFVHSRVKAANEPHMVRHLPQSAD